MTTEQQDVVDRMATTFGSLLIRDHYADGHVAVETRPTPFTHRCTIEPSGRVRSAPSGFVSREWFTDDA